MRRRHLVIATIAATVVSLMPVAARANPAAQTGTPGELSETRRLPDRRTVVSGDRMYQVGAADGSYPATGWHIRGEMAASGRRRSSCSTASGSPSTAGG